MKRFVFVCNFLFATILAGHGAEAAQYDLTGEWSYTTSNQWKKGVCPPGKDATGKCRITQDGDTFTLELLSGMVCKPESMCTFTGGVTGKTFICSNSAVVDDEGGKASNTITFDATSMVAASGTDSSSYEHPEMTCEWGFDIVLSRTVDDIPDGIDTEGGSSGNDGGVDTDSTDDDSADEGGDGGCSLGPSIHRTHISLFDVINRVI